MIMRLMNYMPCLFIYSFVIVYLDDILAYNATWEEHILDLIQVQGTLRKQQLLENIKKCEFPHQCFMYLGYLIVGGELKIDPTKMDAITNQFLLIFMTSRVSKGQHINGGNS